MSDDDALQLWRADVKHGFVTADLTASILSYAERYAPSVSATFFKASVFAIVASAYVISVIIATNPLLMRTLNQTTLKCKRTDTTVDPW